MKSILSLMIAVVFGLCWVLLLNWISGNHDLNCVITAVVGVALAVYGHAVWGKKPSMAILCISAGVTMFVLQLGYVFLSSTQGGAS